MKLSKELRDSTHRVSILMKYCMVFAFTSHQLNRKYGVHEDLEPVVHGGVQVDGN